MPAYYQLDDADPGYVPSLRLRLARRQIEALDALIPQRFADRSDATRRLLDIGLEHLDAAPRRPPDAAA